jgi:hypothetical protein
MQTTTRKFGFPYMGYVGSVLKEYCPPDAATSGSHDYLYRPATGSFARRGGSTTIGEVDPSAPVGILEGKWGARSRRIAEMASASLSDGMPTHSVLYTKEQMTSGVTDDGRFGQLYFYSAPTGKHHVCGDSFGATHYPAGATVPDFMCVPLWYNSGEGGITRLNTKLARRFHCPGSRSFLDVGERRYFPSFDGTPAWWNRRFNEAVGSGTENEQHFPSGPVPPVWAPTFPTTSWPAEQSDIAGWKVGQKCYVAVIFQRSDGSYSAFPTPRGVNSRLPNGLGVMIVPGTPGQYRPYAPWRNIPCGDPSVVRRVLLRSNSVDSLAAALIDPSPDKMMIVAAGVIEDNVTTSFDDYNGDDVSLFADTNQLYVRSDHIMPPPSRYILDFDGRTAHAYGRTSRAAIEIAPAGASTDFDMNAPATSAAVYGSVKFFLCNDGTTLKLKKDDGATHTTSFALASYASLQDLVDAINATLVANSVGGQWRAQVLPGAAQTALPSHLLPNVSTVAGCAGVAGSSTITTSGSFLTLAVGTRITGHANLPTCYVKSVVSATALTICDENGDAAVIATGGFSATTLTFYFDVGDDALLHDSSVGNQRVIAGSYYAFLYFKNSHFAPEASGASSVWMTVGGPNQVRQSANAFVSAPSNKHTPPGNPGICMGGGGLADGAVLLFSNERYVLRNTKGGRTGLDEDYRLDRASTTGCVSPWGVVVGYDWVGFPSQQGYMISRLIGEEILISRALWDNGAKRGDFRQELILCQRATARDDDGAMFYASVVGHELHLCFRNGANATRPERRVVMDFGEGTAASGLEQVLRPDGQPWGWGTPCYQRLSCICSVRRQGGQFLYATDDDNLGSSANGHVRNIETGTEDDGAPITSYLYGPADSCETLLMKGLKATTVEFSATIGATIELAISKDRAGMKKSVRSLVVNPADSVTRQRVLWPPKMAAGCQVIRPSFTDDGSSGGIPEFFGLEAEIMVLDRPA